MRALSPWNGGLSASSAHGNVSSRMNPYVYLQFHRTHLSFFSWQKFAWGTSCCCVMSVSCWGVNPCCSREAVWWKPCRSQRAGWCVSGGAPLGSGYRWWKQAGEECASACYHLLCSSSFLTWRFSRTRVSSLDNLADSDVICSGHHTCVTPRHMEYGAGWCYMSWSRFMPK